MERNGSGYAQGHNGGVAAVLIAAADQIAMRAGNSVKETVSLPVVPLEGIVTAMGAGISADETVPLPVVPLEGTVTKAILDETCNQTSGEIAEEFRSLADLFQEKGNKTSSKILGHQGRPIGFLSIGTNNKVLALYGTKKFTTVLGRIPEDNGKVFIFQGEKRISSSTSTLLMTTDELWSEGTQAEDVRVPTSQAVDKFYASHPTDTLMPSTDAPTCPVENYALSQLTFCPLKWIPYLFKENLTPYEALEIIKKLIQRDLETSKRNYGEPLMAFLRAACTKSGNENSQALASRMQVTWWIPKPDDIISRWAKSLSVMYFDISQEKSRLSSIVPDYSSHLSVGPFYQPKSSFALPKNSTSAQKTKPLPKLKRAFSQSEDEDINKKKKQKKSKSTTKPKTGKSNPATSTMSLADRKKAAAAINSMNAANGNKNDKAAALAAAILRGVTMRPSGKWQAQFYYAGQSRYIGVFQTREKAALAYEIVREKLKSDKPWEKGTMSMKEAEDQVNAARKAAFEGVDEKFRVNCTL